MLDFDAEEQKLQKDIHWATKLEDRLASRAKSRIRNLDDQKEDLESKLNDLKSQRDHMMDIIKGRIRPTAVDLPEKEADDLMTKLRLRIKGVKGIAKEKAEKDIIPVERDIEKAERKIKGLESESERLEERLSEHKQSLSEFARKAKDQRTLLRSISSGYQQIQEMNTIFNWPDPFLILKQVFDESLLFRAQLNRKDTSLKKAENRIDEIESEIVEEKKDLEDSLGEAYERSLMPIVFKNGRSPEGKRFLQNRITIHDVQSLDLISKLTNPKSGDRKADRLSSTLLRNVDLIEGSLLRLAALCQLLMKEKNIRDQAKETRDSVRKSLDRSTDLFNWLIDCAHICQSMQELVLDYLKVEEDRVKEKERITSTLSTSGIDL